MPRTKRVSSRPTPSNTTKPPYPERQTLLKRLNRRFRSARQVEVPEPKPEPIRRTFTWTPLYTNTQCEEIKADFRKVVQSGYTGPPLNFTTMKAFVALHEAIVKKVSLDDFQEIHFSFGKYGDEALGIEFLIPSDVECNYFSCLALLAHEYKLPAIFEHIVAFSRK